MKVSDFMDNNIVPGDQQIVAVFTVDPRLQELVLWLPFTDEEMEMGAVADLLGKMRDAIDDLVEIEEGGERNEDYN